MRHATIRAILLFDKLWRVGPSDSQCGSQPFHVSSVEALGTAVFGPGLTGTNRKRKEAQSARAESTHKGVN